MKTEMEPALDERSSNGWVDMVIPGVFTVVLLMCLLQLGYHAAQAQWQHPATDYAIPAFAN